MRLSLLALMMLSVVCSSEPFELSVSTGEPLVVTLAPGDVENTVNGGIVRPGAQIRVEIIVKNTTSFDLKLGKMWFSCNCSRISTNIDVLKAGESGTASINYDLSWLIGNAETTAFMTFAQSGSNGKIFSTLKTKLITTIAPALLASPSTIDLGHAKQAQALQTEIIITRGLLPITFEDITSRFTGGDDMTISVRKNDNATWTINLHPRNGIPTGSLVNTLEVTPIGRNDQHNLRDYSIQIPIRGTLDGDYSLSPSVCFWGSVIDGETYVRRIKIARVKAIADDIDHTSITLLKPDGGSEFFITNTTTSQNGTEFDLTYKPIKGASPRASVIITGSLLSNKNATRHFKIASLSVK